MTRAKSEYTEQLLVLQGWPHGFCPRHCWEDAACGAWCWPIRMEAARAARELEDFFNSLYGLGWHWRDIRSRVA